MLSSEIKCILSEVPAMALLWKKKGGWGNINRCFFIYTFMSRIPSICMQLGYKFLKHTSRYLNFSLWFKLLLIIHKISLVEDMFIVWLLSARVKFVLSNKCKFFICLSFISSLNKGRVGYSYHYVDLFAIYVLQNKSWCPPPCWFSSMVGKHQLKSQKFWGAKYDTYFPSWGFMSMHHRWAMLCCFGHNLHSRVQNGIFVVFLKGQCSPTSPSIYLYV